MTKQVILKGDEGEGSYVYVVERFGPKRVTLFCFSENDTWAMTRDEYDKMARGGFLVEGEG